MQYSFVKSEALGNDFVILECSSPDKLNTISLDHVQRLCDRRQGVGCDQLIRFYQVDPATIHVVFYNQDGREALACGNGSRALVRYLRDTNRLNPTATLHTKKGQLLTDLTVNQHDLVSLEFDYPSFLPNSELLSLDRIPGLLKDYDLVDVGNLHLVGFVPDPFDPLLDSWGPVLEAKTLFPDGVNVSFAACRGRSHIELRVWERGAGYTGACGTAACATFAAALAHNWVDETNIRVHQTGGNLFLSRLWKDRRPKLQLVGPARTVYEGTIIL